MGIFTTAIGNKKNWSNSHKKYFTFKNTSAVRRLLSDRLLRWKELILASYQFQGFLRTWEKPKAAHSISEHPIREAIWPGGHKSNAEFKYIYFSFISIRYKINLSREADAKPQFASKVSSLDVSNGPRTHSPWHTTVENQLCNPASF